MDYMLHTVQKGTGTPVVFLHGFETSHKYWDLVVKRLPTKTLQVITPDILGFGLSQKPKDGLYDVDQHAESIVHNVLADLEGPVVLVGHSMGAMIATRIAKTHPELVSRLVLVNMPTFTDKKQAQKMILGTQSIFHKAYVSPLGRAVHAGLGTRIGKKVPRFLHGSKPNMADIADEYFTHTRASFLRSLRNTIIGYQPLSDLHSLPMPVSVIYSKDDKYYSGSELTSLRADKMKVINLAGGHHLPLKQYKFLADYIISEAKQIA